jgi:ribosomal protein S18 acetylase RimI-like enzyme
MSEIRQDFRAEALVQAIEENLFAAWSALGSGPGAELRDDEKSLRFTTGIPLPITNGVMRARFPEQSVHAEIDDAIAHFRSRGLPFFWWTSPSTKPADLRTRLEAHGLAPAVELVGMAADLHRIDDRLTGPAGLTLEQVTDRETLAEWGRACFAGYELPASLMEPWCDLVAGLGLEPNGPLRSYVAWQNGEPVACSQLYLAEGVAGIYTVATVPAARRQGIGAVVTLAGLRAAREEGYRIGILHASSMGESVYRRLGFEEYCRLYLSLWTPEGSGASTKRSGHG